MKTKTQSIVQDVTKLLNEKLPKHLSYHNTQHTLYVVEKALHIAKKEGVSKKDQQLVQLGALYHDVGFIKTNVEHEKEGCKIARKQLAAYGYSSKEIEKVCGMIMATKIPQNPKSLLEEIVADADLEYLATSRFKTVGDRLYREMKHYNNKLTRAQWNKIQRDFIANHSYHTKYCKRYKSFRKFKNYKSI